MTESGPHAESGQLTVTRNSAQDVRDRQVYVTLVRKTAEFDLAPGEHARFSVINRPGPSTYALLGLLGTGPIYLTLNREAASS
jgi:hypothetical protein